MIALVLGAAQQDPELAPAAQSLLALIKALQQGEKHIQVAHGTGIAKADHGSTATIIYWWRRSNCPRGKGATIPATAGPIAPQRVVDRAG